MMNHLKIALQTTKDNMKTTLVITILFMGIAAMYGGVYPTFKETMQEMSSQMSEQFSFIPGAEDLASYVGFLNIELYQIFWVLILGIIIGFFAAASISKEIEAKTIDILMSNPVSRKQIVFEKLLGLTPFVIIINFTTMCSVYLTTMIIDEKIDLGNLALTHISSMTYFIAILSMGLLISVVVDEKMKASITMIALIVFMYLLESMSQIVEDFKSLGLLSITHYFNPYDSLKTGKVDIVGQIVLLCVISTSLIMSLIYFEHKDITIS